MAGMGPTIETWAAAVNANWTTAADWSGGIVPSTSSYSAVMNAGSGGYTITFNTTEQVDTFTEDNGTLAISNGAILYLDQSAGNSTISGTVQFTQGQILAYGGSTGHTLTVTSTGAINATSNTSYIAGESTSSPLTLVINPGATVTSSGVGTDLVLGFYSNDVVTNAGTITANGATIGMGGPNGSWTNTGTLQAINNGVIDLSGFFTTASLGGTISATSGGVLDLTGTLTQTGTLAAPASGTYTLYGGTIIGGTIDGSNGALTFSNNGGLLNGVTVINNLSVPASANFRVSNGTTFGGNTSWGGERLALPPAVAHDWAEPDVDHGGIRQRPDPGGRSRRHEPGNDEHGGRNDILKRIFGLLLHQLRHGEQHELRPQLHQLLG